MNLPKAVNLPVFSESLYPFGLSDIFSSVKIINLKENSLNILLKNIYLIQFVKDMLLEDLDYIIS